MAEFIWPCADTGSIESFVRGVQEGLKNFSAKAEPLLGKRVRATINDDEGEKVITTGILLGFSQGGNFEILEDDGFVHYCWPLLKIEEVDE